MTGHLSTNNYQRLHGRQAFVTGAAGFVGANLVRKLVQEGCRVTILVRPSFNNWRLAAVSDSIRWCTGELSEIQSLNGVDAEDLSDLVFHLAAYGWKPSDIATRTLSSNIAGTLNLLDLIAQKGTCRRLVFTSTCAVYGQGRLLKEDSPLNGSTVYALSKISGEAMCRAYAMAHGFSATVLRLFTPYGPYEAADRLVAGSILRALAGADMMLTGGEQMRDYIYIDEVVEALIAAAISEKADGATVNVSTGVSVTIREVVETILHLTGSRAKPLFGAIPYRKDEMWEISGDSEKKRATLDVHNQLSLEDGLRRTCAWFSEHATLYQVA